MLLQALKIARKVPLSDGWTVQEMIHDDGETDFFYHNHHMKISCWDPPSLRLCLSQILAQYGFKASSIAILNNNIFDPPKNKQIQNQQKSQTSHSVDIPPDQTNVSISDTYNRYKKEQLEGIGPNQHYDDESGDSEERSEPNSFPTTTDDGDHEDYYEDHYSNNNRDSPKYVAGDGSIDYQGNNRYSELNDAPAWSALMNQLDDLGIGEEYEEEHEGYYDENGHFRDSVEGVAADDREDRMSWNDNDEGERGNEDLGSLMSTTPPGTPAPSIASIDLYRKLLTKPKTETSEIDQDTVIMNSQYNVKNDKSITSNIY